MPLINSFQKFDTIEKIDFQEKGFLVKSCENQGGLVELRETVIRLICEHTGLPDTGAPTDFLNSIHLQVAQESINELRMSLYNSLNTEGWFRPTYYSFSKSIIETIIGNELAMQNRINLNIMMPGDAGSYIPLHSDPHSGESPFQCVLWIPLTDTYDTKGVFLLPPEANQRALQHFKAWMKEGGRERVMQEIQHELVWAEVPFGSFLLFTPTLLHGSVINDTNETRWSFNTRFKSLFTPYGSQEKGLGSFYLPIRTTPATHFGLQYAKPAGLGES